MKKNDTHLRAKYDISRHHAWAGTVILSLILAIRLFLELAEIQKIPEIIFIIIGLFIASYSLIALFFTYKYRKALIQQISTFEQNSASTKHLTAKQKKKTGKQEYKIQKKKSKNDVKLSKKKIEK